MIYTKEASFSYPVFAENNHSYKDPMFDFDITNLSKDSEDYVFDLDYTINSEFLNQLILNEEARLVFIIHSKDNTFVNLAPQQKTLRLPINRISFDTKTVVQLQIQASSEIHFDNCRDLNEFYSSVKEQIIVPKFSLLGYSGTVTYTNPDHHPVDLFRYSVDNKMDTDFEVELTPDDIHLKFRIKKYLMENTIPRNNLLNMYIYVGLSRALGQFIHNNIQRTDGEEEVDVYLDNIHDAESELDNKLLELMKNKNIESISYASIDEVIHKVSDGIVDRFVKNIEEIGKYED